MIYIKQRITSPTLLLALALAIVLVDTARAQAPSARMIQREIPDRQQSDFIENRGQWDPQAKFLLRSAGLDMWITDHSIVYDLFSVEADTQPDGARRSARRSGAGGIDPMGMERSVHRRGHVVRLSFDGASFATQILGERQRSGYYNYFIGSDSTRWRSNVPLYDGARIENLYKGIDAVFYLDEGRPRYDLMIAAGADPGVVLMKLEGSDGIGLGHKGELVVATSMGVLEQRELYAYQEVAGAKQEVRCRFVVSSDGEVNFAIGSYDHTRPLVIDPLVYSTFVGGDVQRGTAGIAVDSSGNAYITGDNFHGTFPTTTGAYDQSQNGGRDVFVTKVNASGSDLIYSTFIGGNGDESSEGIAIDASGNVYISGSTEGGTSQLWYPTTNNAYQVSPRASSDVFVTKLNANGTALIYSTFIGGSGGDHSRAIAIDDSGNAYIAGSSDSSSAAYPTTAEAYDRSYHGSRNLDLFVTKLNASGSALVYSTLIGGNENDDPTSIAIDRSGNAYVTGFTHSNNFPTTGGAYDQSFNSGATDVFVTKLNASGSDLVYSTYIGGNGDEVGNGIAVDASDNAYITGSTGYKRTIPYPTTSGAYEDSQIEGAFVTKLNARGTALVYSTGSIGGEAIAIDSSSNAYITGSLDSSAIPYPTTSEAYDRSYRGGQDVFVTKLNVSGSALVYSTLIGGESHDYSRDIAVDHRGDIYILGFTRGGQGPTHYPTTSGAFRELRGGDDDVFVSKLSIPPSSEVTTEPTDETNALHLYPVTPNPARNELRISYTLPTAMAVTLDLYADDGRRVATPLVNEKRSAGNHTESIATGSLTPGVYMVRLIAGGAVHVQRFIVVR